MERVVDKPATIRAVERVLLQARHYKLYGSVRKEIRVTANYQPRFHGETNVVWKPVEEWVTDKVDREQREKASFDSVMIVIGRLPEGERCTIEKTYFERERLAAWRIAEKLHISERTLRRWNVAAMLKIADMLELEVLAAEP